MKLLVIGCGSIGKRHVNNARMFAEVGVYDEDKNLAKLIAKETGAKNFKSLNSAFKWLPDGVIIATPTHTLWKIVVNIFYKMTIVKKLIRIVLIMKIMF